VNGVLAGTEPLHLRIFQETLERRGITLTRADYFRIAPISLYR